MSRTKTFSVVQQRWDKFIGTAKEQDRTASAVLRSLIDDFVVGICSRFVSMFLLFILEGGGAASVTQVVCAPETYTPPNVDPRDVVKVPIGEIKKNWRLFK